jgi:hypothetical protein
MRLVTHLTGWVAMTGASFRVELFTGFLIRLLSTHRLRIEQPKLTHVSRSDDSGELYVDHLGIIIGKSRCDVSSCVISTYATYLTPDDAVQNVTARCVIVR